MSGGFFSININVGPQLCPGFKILAFCVCELDTPSLDFPGLRVGGAETAPFFSGGNIMRSLLMYYNLAFPASFRVCHEFVNL